MTCIVMPEIRRNAAQYPELATAVVNGPEAVGDKMRYTFERAIGSKGHLFPAPFAKVGILPLEPAAAGPCQALNLHSGFYAAGFATSQRDVPAGGGRELVAIDPLYYGEDLVSGMNVSTYGASQPRSRVRTVTRMMAQPIG
jgi:hypothetical protein